MAASYKYASTSIAALQGTIEKFIQNYQPTNFSITGTLSAGGNTTLASNTNATTSIGSGGGAVTIGKTGGATTTLRAPTHFLDLVTFSNGIDVNTLTVTGSTVLCQDGTDTLTVAGSSRFEEPVTVTNSNKALTMLTANCNVALGTDTSNTVTSTGTVIAPHFQIPQTSGNSLNVAGLNTILYLTETTNYNIWSNCQSSVVVYVKNTNNSTSIGVTYNSSNTVQTVPSGYTYAYLKTSSTGFVPLQ